MVSSSTAGDGGHAPPVALGHHAGGVGGRGVKARHGVGGKAQEAGLERQRHPGGTGVKGAMAVGFVVLQEAAAGKEESQHRGLGGPSPVELNQGTGQAGVVCGL